jgi:hypothetical protein
MTNAIILPGVRIEEEQKGAGSKQKWSDYEL